MRHLFAKAIGQFLYFAIRHLRLGSASAFPGYIAALLCPTLFVRLSSKAKRIIYVSGTNGKTTTVHLIAHLLGHEKTTFNATGANLKTGLLTALLKPIKENLVLEVDENTLPEIIRLQPPHLLVCLNLFRDQLDRYGETDFLKKTWLDCFKTLPQKTTLFLNADDPALVFMGHNVTCTVKYFGCEKKIQTHFDHAVDSIHCPCCDLPLKYTEIYISHLGSYTCKCGFKRPPAERGPYNEIAAKLIASAILEENRLSFRSPFGRGEKVIKQGISVLLLLAKNPVSLNLSLERARELSQEGNLGGLFFALNKAFADGRDVSWIWDGELQDATTLTPSIFVSGDCAKDLSTCLVYMSEKRPSLFVDSHIPTCLKTALQRTEKGKTLCVIASYTSLLRIRKELVGRKIP